MKTIKFNIFLLSFFVLPSLVNAQRCELIQDVDFSNHSGSNRAYTQAMAQRDFGPLEKNAAGDIRGLDRSGQRWPARNVVGNGVLRAHYPANKAGGKNSGFLFSRSFRPTTEAVMEYKVKFSPGFEYRYGGKLPGLGGFSRGHKVPVGCTQNQGSIQNGFSARVMWRKPQANNKGKLVAYTYFPDRNKRCGVDIPFGEIDTNKWYTIRQYIKLNTPGRKNGILRMSLDGRVKLDKRNVLYRGAGKSHVNINDIVMHTYRGGGATDGRFISRRQGYIEMDDFKVWRNCSNPPAGGSAANPSSSTPVNRPTPNANTVQRIVPFNGSPVTIPGIIEAEEFDKGGQDRSYFDTTTPNLGNNIAREQEAVDIDRAPDGGQVVGWTQTGEWMRYAIDVEQSGTYDVSVLLSSKSGGGKLRLSTRSGSLLFNVPSTQSWDVYQEYGLGTVSLTQGRQVLTLNIEKSGFNIDKLYFTPSVSVVPSDDAAPINPPTQNSPNRCIEYTIAGSRKEIDISGTGCVKFSENLQGKHIAVWDSVDKPRCNFRGTVTVGNNIYAVDSNYVLLENLSGRMAIFNTTNNCPYLKIRMY